MIHLCTIATLMFLQNNTSQKILFIAARTIQFPGVVFKVCIYLIVAIVTSSIYFDVKSTHTYRKYIYQQSTGLNIICNHDHLFLMCAQLHLKIACHNIILKYCHYITWNISCSQSPSLLSDIYEVQERNWDSFQYCIGYQSGPKEFPTRNKCKKKK